MQTLIELADKFREAHRAIEKLTEAFFEAARDKIISPQEASRQIQLLRKKFIHESDRIMSILAKVLRPDIRNPAEETKRIVAKICDVRAEDIDGKSRKPKIANARQLWYLLCTERRFGATPTIGNSCGGRRHSTVIKGSGRARDLLEIDEAFRKQYSLCQTEIDERLYTTVPEPGIKTRRP